jgi:DnaK suppressor protein
VARPRITAALVREFRHRLARARGRLTRTAATTGEELATLEAHPAGAGTEDAPNEVVTASLSRLEGQEKHELDEIDAAQARLETGVFGTCETCGGAIPLARLRAVPHARRCLACQSHAER